MKPLHWAVATASSMCWSPSDLAQKWPCTQAVICGYQTWLTNNPRLATSSRPPLIILPSSEYNLPLENLPDNLDLSANQSKKLNAGIQEYNKTLSDTTRLTDKILKGKVKEVDIQNHIQNLNEKYNIINTLIIDQKIFKNLNLLKNFGFFKQLGKFCL